MAALGDFLNHSGWIEVLIDAGVMTSGVAESLLSASHIKKTRYAHEVTLSALYTLKKEAYDSRCFYHDLDLNSGLLKCRKNL